MIDKGLDLGIPEPEETYSTSRPCSTSWTSRPASAARSPVPRAPAPGWTPRRSRHRRDRQAVPREAGGPRLPFGSTVRERSGERSTSGPASGRGEASGERSAGESARVRTSMPARRSRSAPGPAAPAHPRWSRGRGRCLDGSAPRTDPAPMLTLALRCIRVFGREHRGPAPGATHQGGRGHRSWRRAPPTAPPVAGAVVAAPARRRSAAEVAADSCGGGRADPPAAQQAGGDLAVRRRALDLRAVTRIEPPTAVPRRTAPERGIGGSSTAPRTAGRRRPPAPRARSAGRTSSAAARGSPGRVSSRCTSCTVSSSWPTPRWLSI